MIFVTLLLATGLPRTPVSHLKRGGTDKTRTTSNSSNSKSKVDAAVTSAGPTVAVVAPTGNYKMHAVLASSAKDSNDSDSDDLICLGEVASITPRPDPDKKIKSEPDNSAKNDSPLKSSTGKILMSAWMKRLHIRNNIPFSISVSDASMPSTTVAPAVTAPVVTTPVVTTPVVTPVVTTPTTAPDVTTPSTLPTAVVKPSDSRPPTPVAQSTPIASSTRSKKRTLPEPVPSCAPDVSQPEKKKRKAQKPKKATKSGSKISKSASVTSTMDSESKVTKAAVLPAPVITTTVVLSTSTSTTTTTSTVPSIIAGDVNKTVSSNSGVDVKMASVDGSTSEEDAYDDAPTKTYINLQQRYSAEYANQGIKIKISSKDTKGETSKKCTSQSTSPVVSSSAGPSSSGSGKSKNLHQVIKDKKDAKKRKSVPPSSRSPTYLPFSGNSNTGASSTGPSNPDDKKSVGKVAIDDEGRKKKRVSSAVVVPDPSDSSKSVPKRPSETTVKDEKTSKPSTKVTSPPVTPSRSGTSSRPGPSTGSGSSRPGLSSGSDSTGSSSRPSGSGSGSGSSRSVADAPRRLAVRFSARDGTVKLNSNGYQRLEIREDPAPLVYTTANQSQLSSHQK